MLGYRKYFIYPFLSKMRNAEQAIIFKRIQKQQTSRLVHFLQDGDGYEYVKERVLNGDAPDSMSAQRELVEELLAGTRVEVRRKVLAEVGQKRRVIESGSEAKQAAVMYC